MWRGEVLNKTKSGEERWFDTAISGLAGSDGKPDFYVGVETDITETKEREARLRSLSVAVEQSPASVVITDTNGTIEYVNPRFSEISGYSAEEAIGQNPRILKSEDKSREEYAELWKTITSGETWRGEFHNRRRGGGEYWEAASIAPVKDNHGKISHFLAVKEDISERKEFERRLMAEKHRAEEANVSKMRFLASMSHELRTPLNSILGFSDLMLDPAIELTEDRVKGYSSDINLAGRLLLNHVNDILEYSEIDSGKRVLRPEAVWIEKEARRVGDMLMPDLTSKRILFSVISDSTTGAPCANADLRAVRQIFFNILSNAIKFSPTHGEIQVLLGRKNKFETITILDDGPGISEEKISQVMEPFQRAADPVLASAPGTGLGLSIVKGLIAESKGTLALSNRLEGGFKVEISLPSGKKAA